MHSWNLKRLVTVFSRGAKRPHRPRSLVFRRLMVKAGLEVPEEAPRRRGHYDDADSDSSENGSSITTTEDEDGDDEKDDEGDGEGSDTPAPPTTSASSAGGVEVPIAPAVAPVAAPVLASEVPILAAACSMPAQEQAESIKGLGLGTRSTNSGGASPASTCGIMEYGISIGNFLVGFSKCI